MADVRDLWAGNPYYDRGSRVLAGLQGRALRRADAVATVTEGCRVSLLGLHAEIAERLHVLPNGFDPALLGRRAPAAPHDGPARLIYAGALYGEHNAVGLVEALRVSVGACGRVRRGRGPADPPRGRTRNGRRPRFTRRSAGRRRSSGCSQPTPPSSSRPAAQAATWRCPTSSLRRLHSAGRCLRSSTRAATPRGSWCASVRTRASRRLDDPAAIAGAIEPARRPSAAGVAGGAGRVRP